MTWEEHRHQMARFNFALITGMHERPAHPQKEPAGPPPPERKEPPPQPDEPSKEGEPEEVPVHQ